MKTQANLYQWRIWRKIGKEWGWF